MILPYKPTRPVKISNVYKREIITAKLSKIQSGHEALGHNKLQRTIPGRNLYKTFCSNTIED